MMIKCFSAIMVQIILTFTLQAAATESFFPKQTQEHFNLVEMLSISEFSSKFSTSSFARILHKAELANRVAHEGPFTLLVPTNRAFSFLNKSFMRRIANDNARLRAFVSGHILPLRIPLSQLRNRVVSMTTLLGDSVRFTTSNRRIFVNESLVVIGDIEASNGIIHVIDKVLAEDDAPTDLQEVPSSDGNIMSKIQSEQFSIFRELLVQARLYNFLGKGGSFTLFAPVDEAFKLLNPTFLRNLKSNPNVLRSVLLHHILPGGIKFPELLGTLMVKSVNKKILILSSTTHGLFVNQTRVLQKDLVASNGIVHVIDNLLVPSQNQRISFPSSIRLNIPTLDQAGIQLPTTNVWSTDTTLRNPFLPAEYELPSLPHLFTLIFNNQPFLLFNPH